MVKNILKMSELSTILKQQEIELENKIKGFNCGFSLVLNKKCYLLTKSAKEGYVISEPKLKHDGIDTYYDFKDRINYKKLNSLSFEKDIEKYISSEEKKLDTKGSIYLVTDGLNTKIGATSYNVKKRLNELQTGNAKKLKLVYSYNVANKISTESFLHDMFKEKNVLNEWFLLSFEDIDKIMNEKIEVVSNFETLSIKDLENIRNCVGNISEEFKQYKNKLHKRFDKKRVDIFKEFSTKLSFEECKDFSLKKYRY